MVNTTKPDREPMRMITVRIPAEIHDSLRIVALNEQVSMNTYVKNLLRATTTGRVPAKRLDEYTTRDLEEEIERRKLQLAVGRCDYCGRRGDSLPYCSKPARHEQAYRALRELERKGKLANSNGD